MDLRGGTNAAFAAMALAIGLCPAGTAVAQDADLRKEFGVFTIAPKSPDFGPGAIMLGYFDRSGTQLKSELTICKSKFEITADDLANCKSKQSTMSAAKTTDRSFDITAVVKKLIGIEAKASQVKNVTLSVKDGCLFEMDLEQAEEELSKRPICLDLTAKQRKFLSKDSLITKLKNPGEYKLIWQTTRALYATYIYKMEFKSGASLGLKTEAAELLKGNSGSISGKASNADDLELKGEGIILGIGPRYYEQWFKTAGSSQVAGNAVETVNRDRERLVAELSKPATRGATRDEIGAVEKAAGETDAKIKELLAKAAK